MSDDRWEYPLKDRIECNLQKTIMFSDKDPYPVVDTVFNTDQHDMDVSIHHCVWDDGGERKICNLCCKDGSTHAKTINTHSGIINNQNKG